MKKRPRVIAPKAHGRVSTGDGALDLAGSGAFDLSTNSGSPPELIRLRHRPRSGRDFHLSWREPPDSETITAYPQMIQGPFRFQASPTLLVIDENCTLGLLLPSRRLPELATRLGGDSRPR